MDIIIYETDAIQWFGYVTRLCHQNTAQELYNQRRPEYGSVLQGLLQWRIQDLPEGAPTLGDTNLLFDILLLETT